VRETLSLSRINRERESESERERERERERKRERDERDGEKAFPVFGRVPGSSTTGDVLGGLEEEEEVRRRKGKPWRQTEHCSTLKRTESICWPPASAASNSFYFSRYAQPW
jgi:hypothetical protein